MKVIGLIGGMSWKSFSEYYRHRRTEKVIEIERLLDLS